jgi:hypothetical protein
MEEKSNNSRGGQPGNKNGTKNKPFLDALRKAIAQNPQKLRNAADKVLEKAEEGEPWAVNFLADRTDGKAVQATTFEDGDGNNVTTSLEVRFHAPAIIPTPVDD